MLLYLGEFRKGRSEKNDNTMVNIVSTEESYWDNNNNFTIQDLIYLLLSCMDGE